MTYVGEPLAPLLEGVLPNVTHVYWQLVNGASRPFDLDRYERELEAMMALAAEHREKVFMPLDCAWTRLQSPSPSIGGASSRASPAGSARTWSTSPPPAGSATATS